MSIKKTVYTVCVNNYLPEICSITIPTIQAYAGKIGANFHLITERKFPEFPPTYEKMQVFELGVDNDWNILIDADIILSKNMPDLTLRISPFYVATYMLYQADLLFSADPYFLRDGRRIGVCTNFVVTSKMCHDVWTPLEYGWDIAKNKTKREHIIDEFCFSRNLARFGLKISGIDDKDPPTFFLHLDATTKNEKDMLDKAKEYLDKDAKKE